MNFKIVIETLIKRFDAENISFAFIGAFAVNAAGYSRTTQDIDFIVPLEDADKVHKVMSGLDYKLLKRDNEIAIYASDVEVFGRVDYLFAHREISKKMLKRAKEKPILNGLFKPKVVNPEDIIGLKLQAIENNPSRIKKDMLDIENIIRINKDTIDLEFIKEYFSLFGKVNELNKILNEGKHA